MAKFNVGDRCIHTDIVGHMDKCIVTKADKPGRYTVEFYLGGEKEVAESSLRKIANARVSNAKFEVGKIYGPNSSGWLLKVTPRKGDMVKGMIGSSVSDFPKRGGKFYEDTYFVDGNSANEVIHTQYDKFKASKTVANIAANAKFKVGDRVRHGNVMYISKTNEDRLVGTITRWDDDRGMWEVKFKGDPKPVYWSSKEMVKYNSRACNRASVYEYGVGDTVKLRSGRTGEVLSKYVDKDGNLSIEINLNGTRYAVSADMVDSVVKNSRACNAKFKAGDKAYVHWFSGEDELVDVISYEPKGDYYIVRGEDGQLAHPKASLLYPVKNSRACNSKNAIVRKAMNATALNFSPGDKVSIVDTDIRYGGDKGEVVRKDGFRYVVRLTSRQDKPEVTLQPNQLKAANSEDAQGHEHGSDGKFASKGGGSDGGDSYEDPKTKRMKERLAKMREKNEALRKDIEARKAALISKKAGLEKMRAEVMKANVDKWKAGLPKTKNTIVEKAINAVAKNDKWIDDFHVIVTGGTPDKELVDALKKKAAAWKAAKRNFSDAAAGAAHDKAESDAMAVAKRLGARWVQQGAVLKVIMPNSVAKNADIPGRFTSSELSTLKSAVSKMKGAQFSQYPDRMREKLVIRGPNYTEISVEKSEWEGQPVQYSVRGQGARSAFKGKYVSSIKEAATVVKRMVSTAMKQDPYSFGLSDFYD